MTAIERVNLTLRAVMEFGVVVGFAYWGYQAGGRPATKLGLAIVTPVVGFGIWGAVDFHQFGRAAELLRLAEEMLLSGLAAAAFYAAGRHALGWTLAGLSVVYHVLVYASGARLLGPRGGSG